jgi:uncharacterized protein
VKPRTDAPAAGAGLSAVLAAGSPAHASRSHPWLKKRSEQAERRSFGRAQTIGVPTVLRGAPSGSHVCERGSDARCLTTYRLVGIIIHSESRDGHREGWSSALDNLQTLFPAADGPSASPGASASTSGRFVWYDLLTTDAEAAKAFYTAAVGWTVQSWGEGSYAVWLAGETQIGGVMEYPPVPPHWMAHVSVDDVDAAARRAEELGGRIQAPPADIPNVGRFAVVADPQGASFSLFRPNGEVVVPDGKLVRGVGWRELHATDHDGVWPFYRDLFGWKEVSTFDMGEPGTYRIFRHPADQEDAFLGGMFNGAALETRPPHWLYYVNVDSMDGALSRIEKAGGKLLEGPMPVASGGQSAHCMDPQGARFAIFALA